MNTEDMQQHAEQALAAVTILQTEVLRLCDCLRNASSFASGDYDQVAILQIVIATAQQNILRVRQLSDSISALSPSQSTIGI